MLYIRIYASPPIQFLRRSFGFLADERVLLYELKSMRQSDNASKSYKDLVEPFSESVRAMFLK